MPSLIEKVEDPQVRARAESVFSQFMQLGKMHGVHFVSKASRQKFKDEVTRDLGRNLSSYQMNHEMAKRGAPFTNDKTFDNYVSYARSFSVFIAQERPDKGIDVTTDIGKQVVDRWLQYRIDLGKTLGNYQGAATAATHFQAIINKHAEKHGDDRRVNFERVKAKNIEVANNTLESRVEARAYERPQEIIEKLDKVEHQLVASIQLEGGARIFEASLIDDKRLGGLVEVRGQEMGAIDLLRGDAKGGLERTLHVPKETYVRIEAYVREHGKLHLEGDYQKSAYRSALKEAAQATGQTYTGSHSLRHNYCQARMEQELSTGADRRDALSLISIEMGHFRPDITAHYLTK